MLSLSEKERHLIVELQDAGVLQDIKERPITGEQVVLLTCSDFEFRNDLEKIFWAQPRPKIHIVSHCGGATRIVPLSPLNQCRGDRQYGDNMMYLQKVMESLANTNSKVAVVLHEVPCEKAVSSGVDLAWLLKLIQEAKEGIKREDQAVAVYPYLDLLGEDIFYISSPKLKGWTACAHK